MYSLCFNALMGLSCYLCQWHQDLGYNSFNALMGLSCYDKQVIMLLNIYQFQCPHGLELLHIVFIAVIPDN